jgi:hypothetical protein
MIYYSKSNESDEILDMLYDLLIDVLLEGVDDNNGKDDSSIC